MHTIAAVGLYTIILLLQVYYIGIRWKSSRRTYTYIYIIYNNSTHFVAPLFTIYGLTLYRTVRTSLLHTLYPAYIGVNWSIHMRFLGRRRRRRVFGGHVRYQLIMMFRGARER